MSTREVTELLATVPLLAGLKRRHLATIAASAHTRSVERYTKLITQDDLGETCFVILDGTAEVRHDSQPVADLGPGSVFGELALLDGGPRLADVTMTSSGEILEIGRAGFDQLLTESTDAARAVMTQLASRLRESEAVRFTDDS